jgi:hypothetical protein
LPSCLLNANAGRAAEPGNPRFFQS